MADIINTASNTLLSGTSDADSIRNGGDYVSINTGKGKDTVVNWGNDVTIVAGASNDKIYNRGKYVGFGYYDGFYVTINGDAGNDFIQNEIGNFVSIQGGAGSDTIENFGGRSIDGMEYVQTEYVTIDGGAGDDTIYTRGEHTTVAGGKGNDSIRNDGRTILFVYADGDDTIEGFTSGCKLKIGSGKSITYSKEIIGSDIIVTVGDGKITLVGAANLDTPNIIGTEVETTSWTLNGTTATYTARSRLRVSLLSTGSASAEKF